MTDTARLRLPELSAAQAQKHVTHNEALVALDTLVQLSVLDKDLTAPPGSPAEGDCYIVAAAASGEWTGWENRIARYEDGAWRSYLPGAGDGTGWLAYVQDEDTFYVLKPGGWTAVTGLSLGTAAFKDIGASGDTLGTLDANKTDSGNNTYTGNLTFEGTLTYAGTARWGDPQVDGTGAGVQVTEAGGQYITRLSATSTGTVQQAAFYNPNGNVGSIRTSGSGTSFNTSSDGRLKINRVPLAEEVDIPALFSALEPFAFDWLNPVSRVPTGERGHGFVLQDVRKTAATRLAHGGEGEPGDEGFEYGALDLAGFTPYLWAGVRSLLAEVSDLRARHDDLEHRIAVLEGGLEG